MPDDHVAQQYARIPGTARSRYLNGTLHTYCVSHGPARGDLFNQGCVSSMILHPEWLTLLAKRFWSDFVGRSPRTGCIRYLKQCPVYRLSAANHHGITTSFYMEGVERAGGWYALYCAPVA